MWHLPQACEGWVGGLEGGWGKDMFRHAQSPGLENSLTPLINGMFRLHRKQSGGSWLRLGGSEDDRECSPDREEAAVQAQGRGITAPRH